MGTMLFIWAIAAFLFAVVFVKISLCIAKLAFKLLFGFFALAASIFILPIVLLVFIPIAAAICVPVMLAALIAMPIIQAVMLTLITFLLLPFILIKRLVF